MQDRLASLKGKKSIQRKHVVDEQELLEKGTKKKNNDSVDESVAESVIGVAEELCVKADRAFNGHGEAQNFEKARLLYSEASQLGSGKACACLAKMYENGIGVDKNLTEAFNLYRQGASLGDITSMFALGKYYEKNLVPENEANRGMEDAVSYYERAAREGYAEALTKLGYMYEQGIYYKEDKKEAAKYYTRAAEQGDALAINYLGLYYYKQGLDPGTAEQSRDRFLQKGAELFKKSRELGCARAANNLGMCYEQGAGVEKDFEQAFVCYKEAADKGYAQGMFNLGYLYLRKAKANKLMEYYEKAAHWLRCAINADNQLVDGYFYLGFLFEKGLGVDHDFQTAFNYYRHAAQLNHPQACKRCGDMLYSGHDLLAPDKSEAMKYYNKAAELGDPDAHNALGLIYENGGDGIEKNDELAFQSYLKAEQLGCADASVNLALMYENGQYVPQDSEKAKDLMIEAATKGSHLARDYLISNGIVASFRSPDKNDASAIVHDLTSSAFWAKKPSTLEKILDTEFKSGAQTFGNARESRRNILSFGGSVAKVTEEKKENAEVRMEKNQPSRAIEKAMFEVANLPRIPVEVKQESKRMSRECSPDEKLSLPELSPGTSPMAKKVEDDVAIQPGYA